MCNVDATILRSRGMISYGAVLRSARGDFIAVKSDILLGRFEAREAEAIGVREALSWLKKFSFQPIVLEIDSLQVFHALHDKDVYQNGFGTIIADCRDSAQSRGEVTFSFIRRSANTTAHIVARCGSMSGLGEWRHVLPP